MEITVTSLSQTFGTRQALQDIDLTFPSGQLTSILGPSGCGKSTMLNIIAGILEPTTGTVRYGGKDVTSLPPEKRNLGFVFQNYALYPHLTVAQNIGYPLRFIRGMGKPERSDRVAELAALVRVTELLDHRPGELSGGQQQRVAIARALAKRPGVVLMDEPLSNLDARLRGEMREEIRRIQSESGVTMVLVTHDQEDALSISDQVVVMRAGHVEQVSSPIATYAQPQSLFVVDFIGEPPATQLPVRIAEDATVHLVSGAFLPLTAPATLRGERAPLTLAVRADSVSIGAEASIEHDSTADPLDSARTPQHTMATIAAAIASRQGYLYELRLEDGTMLRARAGQDSAHQVGELVPFSVDAATVFYFDPTTEARRG